MTQEEKSLLLKDLSARLPYEVVLKIGDHSDYKLIGIVITDENPIKVVVVENGIPYKIEVPPDIIKPYLRPMKDMTEDEKDKYSSFVLREHDGYLTDGMPDYTGKHYVYIDNVNIFIDWLSAHHLDYYGLIEKGLALEAPEGMYKMTEE